MPTAPALPCVVASCPERRPCPTHGGELASARERAKRGARPPWFRWYHVQRWRHPVYGLRARALRRDPLCVECKADGVVERSTEVDHVVPHRGDPRLFWSFENLAGLCHWHHGRKTARGE